MIDCGHCGSSEHHSLMHTSSTSSITEQGWKDAWEREWERMKPLYRQGLPSNTEHDIKSLARTFFLTGYVASMQHETNRMLKHLNLSNWDRVERYKP